MNEASTLLDSPFELLNCMDNRIKNSLCTINVNLKRSCSGICEKNMLLLRINCRTFVLENKSGAVNDMREEISDFRLKFSLEFRINKELQQQT